jgi:hypothetical protein
MSICKLNGKRNWRSTFVWFGYEATDIKEVGDFTPKCGDRLPHLTYGRHGYHIFLVYLL